MIFDLTASLIENSYVLLPLLGIEVWWKRNLLQHNVVILPAWLTWKMTIKSSMLHPSVGDSKAWPDYFQVAIMFYSFDLSSDFDFLYCKFPVYRVF